MRIFLFLLFSLQLSSQTAQDTKELADSLLLSQNVDSCIVLLNTLDRDQDSSVDFRLKILEAIRGGTENEVTVKNIENIIAEYRDQAFPTNTKVAYMNYFSEIMIPDNSWNEYNLGYLDDILLLYDEGHAQDSFLLMHMLHNKGNLLFELGRNIEAIPQLEQAINIAQKIDTRDSSFLGILYFNLANPVYSAGQYQRSYELVEKSEAHLSKLSKPNLDYFQTVYIDLFSTSLEFDYLEKAEKYLNKAKLLYERNKVEMTGGKPLAMAKKEITLVYNYMSLYAETLEYDKALSALREAEEKFGNYTDIFFRVRLAASYNKMGEMYVINEPEKSFYYYQRAIDIFNDKEDLKFSLMFEFNLSKAYLNSGQLSKAKKLARSLVSKGESIDDRRLPFFYFLEAKMLLKEGNFEESLPILNTIANLFNKGEDPIDLIEQQTLQNSFRTQDIDHAYLLSGIASEIEKNIDPSIDSNTAMNSLWKIAYSSFQELWKLSKLNKKAKKEYGIMLSGLLRTDEFLGRKSLAYGEVLKFSENINSRVMWEEFKTKNAGLELLDQDLLVKEQEIRSRITGLKKKVNGFDSLSVREALFEEELALEKLEVEKRQKNNSFYKYEDFDFDFASYQGSLGENELVIKYQYLDSTLYRYQISGEEIKLHAIEQQATVDELVKDFVELIRDPSSDIGEIETLGNSISELLLPNELSSKLSFIGDGILNYLPFDLLRLDNTYLLENYAISNATSLALLNNTEVHQVVKESLIVAPSYENYTLSSQQLAVRGDAYSLKGALSEAETISTLIPSEKWTRENALKQEFMEKAGDFDLLHLSMHSFMNDDDPELSSLVFHDNDQDNELYISELYGLNLNAKLAVLSACNTGVGKIKSGEGMVSVNRAFTYAGVPSVVSSLWSAPDKATQELMTLFYEQLKEGKSKDQALREAKLNYLSQQEVKGLQHPFFWAGFVLHGNTEPLKFERSKIYQFLFAGGVIILVLLIIFSGLRLIRSKESVN